MRTSVIGDRFIHKKPKTKDRRQVVMASEGYDIPKVPNIAHQSVGRGSIYYTIIPRSTRVFTHLVVLRLVRIVTIFIGEH